MNEDYRFPRGKAWVETESLRLVVSTTTRPYQAVNQGPGFDALAERLVPIQHLTLHHMYQDTDLISRTWDLIQWLLITLYKHVKGLGRKTASLLAFIQTPQTTNDTPDETRPRIMMTT